MNAIDRDAFTRARIPDALGRSIPCCQIGRGNVSAFSPPVARKAGRLV
jgi:hypothetical protein